MKIVFEGEQPLSWNKMYAGLHWTKRAAHANRVHLLVHSKTSRCKRLERPVRIIFTAYLKRQMDVDNYECKSWIDGLKKYVLHDDTPEFVKELVVRHGGKDRIGRIEIEIEEIN